MEMFCSKNVLTDSKFNKVYKCQVEFNSKCIAPSVTNSIY